MPQSLCRANHLLLVTPPKKAKPSRLFSLLSPLRCRLLLAFPKKQRARRLRALGLFMSKALMSSTRHTHLALLHCKHLQAVHS